jgi:uncharacterized coiled-coil protein SlyX
MSVCRYQFFKNRLTPRKKNAELASRTYPTRKEQTMKIPHSFSRLLLIVFALSSFALCQVLEAVMPAPDGGYPGGNTAEGTSALLNLNGGGFNTAIGWFSLKSTITGSFNTGVGTGTLLANIADRNTATGAGALFHNRIGADNTGNGTFALFDNDAGYSNTATGVEALGSNLVGYQNTAEGVDALVGNTYGVRNTATGAEGLFSNVVGNYNTATGFQALHSNTEGNYNTAIGGAALYRTTGGGNIGLGFNAGVNLTTGDLNIDIGDTGLAAESRTIRIGTQGIHTATYVGGIFGATLTDGVPVLVGIDGHLGTAFSSKRFKEEIEPMDKASEAIMALKPVAFHYRSDAKNKRQFGLIAEEVAEVNPDLVVRDKNGEIYTVRYEAVNAMLLNEFLKEHKIVEAQQGKLEKQEATISELKSTVAQQQKEMEVVTAQLKEEAAQIQRVSAQFELGKPELRAVLNDQ